MPDFGPDVPPPELSPASFESPPAPVIQKLTVTGGGKKDVSLTVTVDDVAMIGPDVEPVRICMIMVSEPSPELRSLFRVRLMDPDPDVSVKLPELAAMLKSAAVVVPPLVQ